jgi:hypothetical protein
MKSVHSAYSEMILIEIREDRFFLDGVVRALDGHVIDFLTNESLFRGSRVV